MKKLIALVGIMAVGMTAYGQGLVNFANLGAGWSAPINQLDGSPVPAGGGFTAELLAGADAGSLVAVTPTTSNWVVPGLFNGGVVTIPGQAPLSTPMLQVVVWENAGGTILSYADAQAAGVQHGASAIWTAAALGGAGTPPGPPSSLIGMTSFSLVPEPSTYALLALGAAALFLRRRK